MWEAAIDVGFDVRVGVREDERRANGQQQRADERGTHYDLNESVDDC